jgi:MoxR-like ATPase
VLSNVGLGYEDVKFVVSVGFKSKTPVLIWGQPGIGKSALVRDLASGLSYTIQPPSDDRLLFHPRLITTYGNVFVGRRVSDVRLALMSPTTIMGIPVYSSETRDAVWCMSGLFPMDPARVLELERMVLSRYLELVNSAQSLDNDVQLESLVDRLIVGLHEQHSILFLDELGQAPPAVQSAAFGLLLDRKIQAYTLPSGVDIVSATNNYEDRAGVNRLTTPLVSRLSHVTMAASLSSWSSWAIASGVDPDVVSFVKYSPDLFHKFNPNTQSGSGELLAFPCPRTWEMAARTIAALKRDGQLAPQRLFMVLSGCVGEGAAAQFVAWHELYQKLPNPEEILKGSKTRADINFDMKTQDGTNHNLSLEYCYMLNIFRTLIELEKSADDEKMKEYLDRFVRFCKGSKHREYEAVMASLIISEVKRGNPRLPKYIAANETLSETVRSLVKSEIWIG